MDMQVAADSRRETLLYSSFRFQMVSQDHARNGPGPGYFKNLLKVTVSEVWRESKVPQNLAQTRGYSIKTGLPGRTQQRPSPKEFWMFMEQLYRKDNSPSRKEAFKDNCPSWKDNCPSWKDN